ncbi:MAG: hypothetical protein ACD_2C00175G0002 [uncultured bacterium (gcode 4)]|uniref:Sortase family protein n=1 Tax=uncultured bacterium (gcode 4) TaxID=1234023 RepID=K2GGA0_9BACT|nr:MAG: hypothetical protein ACD_2C00175G0002 [uncultured bacterium (gcode 4)]
MHEITDVTNTSTINDIDYSAPTLDLSILISELDDKLEVCSPVQESVITPAEPAIAEDIAMESYIMPENPIIIPEETAQEEAIPETTEEVKAEYADDFLKMIGSIDPASLISIWDETEDRQALGTIEEEFSKINSERKHRKIAAFIIDKAKFLANYVAVSAVVFFILLWVANYSAYSTIAYNFINPNNLKNSSKEILSVIDNSKIKVFADEDTSLLWADQQKTIQKKLAEDNAQLRDTYFSPKKLVPLNSNVNLSVDIVPYENRLIIPKIWKNIPLVDVDSRRWNLDFTNLENIFMNELEKWVLRYPWTAKPGETGNAFIFGHSSNYPWLKWDYNDVFAMLDQLNFWDEIIVYYNQKKYTYVITEKKVIKPGNVKILERDPTKKELSLMTCWPIGTSINRLITFAELKSVN